MLQQECRNVALFSPAFNGQVERRTGSYTKLTMPKSLSFKKKGYYLSWQRLDQSQFIKKALSVSKSNTYPILLRKIKHPVEMYAKQASVNLPSQDGTYGYDLMIGDLVEPHGKGKTTDMLFQVSPYTNAYNRISLNFDILFASERDGIQRFDFPRDDRDHLPRSKYVFPYLAPRNGYFSSLSKADENVSKGLDKRKNSSKRYNEANYIFQVRSLSKGGSLYGRISGFFRVSPRNNSKSNINFTYFLNPSGSKNLEYDPKKNLIKNLARYEYVPKENYWRQ